MLNISKLKSTSRARWFVISTRAGEFEALVEPFGNKEWRKMHDRLTAPYRRKMRENDGDLDPKVYDPILAQCTAHTIWKDWRKIVDDDGNAVEFSPEQAMDLLEDDEIRAGINKAALELAKVNASEIEDEEKN